jgi:uncharacterized surface protein with fasciclin (FAS1) repeats
MRFNHLLSTAAAAALLACPVLAVAQPAPPAPTAPPAAAPAAAATPAPVLPPSPNLVANGDLIATLKASPHFTILAKAFDANNLSASLKAAPGLTLFAPTDDAFNALPAGQLQMLMMPANANLLRKVLTYHLINATVDASKIKGAKGPVNTVEAGSVQLDGSGDVLMVNNANIIQADVKAANGVIIHAIDKVLIPADVTLPGAAAAAAPATAHVGG